MEISQRNISLMKCHLCIQDRQLSRKACDKQVHLTCDSTEERDTLKLLARSRHAGYIRNRLYEIVVIIHFSPVICAIIYRPFRMRFTLPVTCYWPVFGFTDSRWLIYEMNFYLVHYSCRRRIIRVISRVDNSLLAKFIILGEYLSWNERDYQIWDVNSYKLHISELR